MNDRFVRRGPKAIWIGVSVVVIVFGVWLLVRAFAVAFYSVPTMAMEKTIRLGNKIVVNKLTYRPVNRGDILVFHFPEGDTIIDKPEFRSMRPYYDVIRELGRGNADSGRQIVLADPDDYPLTILPIYRREAYLKRCIAIAGDTLQMRGEMVYINGRPQAWPEESETYFHVVTNGRPLDVEDIKSRYGVDIANADDVRPIGDAANATEFEMLLTWKARDNMLKNGFARKISPDIDSSTEGIFPADELHHWTRDDYGPLWIPKKGASIQLTPLNYPIYERIIRTYEGNKLVMRDGKIYINDREETSYTFKMNYYWVIGDNLHGSQDSRYWGFVPDDHMIGKVSAIL
jgi:signal peptidase I